jgi:hypothetical protein
MPIVKIVIEAIKYAPAALRLGWELYRLIKEISASKQETSAKMASLKVAIREKDFDTAKKLLS